MANTEINNELLAFPIPQQEQHLNLLSVRISEPYGLVEQLVLMDEDYYIRANDRYVIAKDSITMYLPDVSSGRAITIKNKGATDSTVSGDGKNIDGSATVALATNTAATFVFDGTEWYEI